LLRRPSIKNIKNSASIASGLSDSISKNKKTLNVSPRLSTYRNNSSIEEANFEDYFKTNFPWQNIYISQNVEKSLEEVNYYLYYILSYFYSFDEIYYICNLFSFCHLLFKTLYLHGISK
jgi:hypothetical protein